MKNSATESELGSLHTELAKILKKQIKMTDEDGKANASILNVARQFLKDNGIDASPEHNQELKELSEELPFEGINVTPFRKTA